MAESNEGGIIGKGDDDSAFHEPILSNPMPPELLARLKAQAEELGLDPRLIQQ